MKKVNHLKRYDGGKIKKFDDGMYVKNPLMLAYIANMYMMVTHLKVIHCVFYLSWTPLNGSG